MSLSVSPSSTRQQNRRHTQRKTDECVIYLFDIEGLPETHALSAARTLSAIKGAPEFEARQLTTVQDVAAATNHRLAYFLIQNGAVICTIQFLARGREAHINAADCYTAYPYIHPRSYMLFHTMAQLLDRMGFRDVILVANKHQRRFFQTLGFHRTDGRWHASPVEIAVAAASVYM
jgi:hypothetical protein